MADPEKEQKELVEKYLVEHNLQTVVSEVINTVVQKRDPFPLERLGDLLRFRAAEQRGIISVKACEILDSRGNPTVRASVTTPLGVFSACVPSGASTGVYEAHELRDGDKQRYRGKGVCKAVENIHAVLGPAIVGMDPRNQQAVDNALINADGTKNKSNLGANAILAVSMAVARAGAAHANVPLFKHIAQLAGNDRVVLPLPSFNVINGGKHAANPLAFQEFMIMPAGAQTFAEAIRIGAEVYHTLKDVIAERYGKAHTHVADEGGFAPPVDNPEEVLELLTQAVEKAGYSDKVKFAMDVAASEFHLSKDQLAEEAAAAEAQGKKKQKKKKAEESEEDERAERYDLQFKLSGSCDPLPQPAEEETESAERAEPAAVIRGNPELRELLTTPELLRRYLDMCDKYPIASIEDPFDQDDWDGFTEMTDLRGNRVQIVGDDLLVTNIDRVKLAIRKGSGNALLLKVNQIGTVWEAIRACQIAQENDWGVMVSHRSGETEDDFIADLCVGLRAGQLKSGAPCRSERLCKYNRILCIEDELKETEGEVIFAGSNFRRPPNA